MSTEQGQRRSTWPAVSAYLGLSAAWIAMVMLAAHWQPGGTTGWLLRHVVPAALLLAVAWIIARRVAPDEPATLLSLRRPTMPFMAIALLSAVPSLAVVLWHAIGEQWLLTPDAAVLSIKLAFNKGLLEEWLARGLLLDWFVLDGNSQKRAIGLSALMFGVMHMFQYLTPPFTAERLINGVVLVVLTTPMGALYAWLTLRARSLWPAVTLHFLSDLLILPQKLATPNLMLISFGAFGSLLLAALLLHLYLPRQRVEL
ncbi:MAG: CPBP family intramembrane glutamic endopeptidase [Polyangiaceae bacterium]